MTPAPHPPRTDVDIDQLSHSPLAAPSRPRRIGREPRRPTSAVFRPTRTRVDATAGCTGLRRPAVSACSRAARESTRTVDLDTSPPSPPDPGHAYAHFLRSRGLTTTCSTAHPRTSRSGASYVVQRMRQTPPLARVTGQRHGPRRRDRAAGVHVRRSAREHADPQHGRTSRACARSRAPAGRARRVPRRSRREAADRVRVEDHWATPSARSARCSV